MQIYLVGGAVRDELLGLGQTDRDWVVVGATPAEMKKLRFQPVGRDFPVFLHPDSKEEYALARTERKTAPGYHGFVVHAAPGVTLEQDLARRDLTINAMARDAQGRLIDPYGGWDDLKAGVLRHVTGAFREDPVRILRLARFAARFPRFVVAPDTLALAQQMVAAGEVDALEPQRVWQEVERGLRTETPSRMAGFLMDCGAWEHLWPELDRHHPERTAMWPRLDHSCVGPNAFTLGQRWALWCHGATPKQVAAISERLRVPKAAADLALGWASYGHDLQAPLADATTACALLHRMDAQRRPNRVLGLVQLASIQTHDPVVADHARHWQRALQALTAVDAKAVNQQAVAAGLRGPQVGQALMQAQSEAIARLGGFLKAQPGRHQIVQGQPTA